MNATPATVQAQIDAGQRNVTLDPAPGYPNLYVRGPLNLSGATQAVTVPSVNAIGYIQGLNISNLTIRGGGIQVVDGIQALRLRDVAIEGVGGVGLNVTGPNTRPSLNLWMENVRIRDCHIGMMLGQVVRWTAYNTWIDRCQSPTNPTDSAYHGAYLNDANCLAGDNHGMLISRCPGTSFRGTGSRCYDLIAYQSGVCLAGSKNCEIMARPTAIEAGPIEIGTQIPCTVEDPYGPIYIKLTCRSPYLVIQRPRYGPGQALQDDAHYPIADQDVPGRFGALVVIDPVQVAANPRTPATYCRDKLGGTASLDDLWTRPFSVVEMNRWIRGGA